MERLAPGNPVAKTVRGKRCKTHYVKIALSKPLAERIEAYNIYLDEDTGRITLEPVYRREKREDRD